jgi:hypothetical protein
MPWQPHAQRWGRNCQLLTVGANMATVASEQSLPIQRQLSQGTPVGGDVEGVIDRLQLAGTIVCSHTVKQLSFNRFENITLHRHPGETFLHFAPARFLRLLYSKDSSL